MMTDYFPCPTQPCQVYSSQHSSLPLQLLCTAAAAFAISIAMASMAAAQPPLEIDPPIVEIIVDPHGAEPIVRIDPSIISPPPELESHWQAIEIAASTYGADPQNLEIVNMAMVEFPLQDLRLREFKIVEIGPEGRSFSLLLDADGETYDGERLRETETQLRADQSPGKFDPQAFERWQAAGGDNQWLTIWLREPAYDLPERPEPQEDLSASAISALAEEVNHRRAAHVENVVSPFLEQLRNLVDHDVFFDYEAEPPLHRSVRYDYFSPVVYLRAEANLLPEIASWEEVEFIYQPVAFAPTLAESRYSAKTGYLESTHALTGKEVRIAMIEEGPVATSPWLASIDSGSQQQRNTLNTHATGVAGILASRHPRHRGLAPDAKLWNSALRFSFNPIPRNLDSAAHWGARVINMSLAAERQLRHPVATTRKVEQLVHNNWLTVVAGSGNQPSRIISSPGDSYNAITVGGYLHQGTRAWPDDTLATRSGSINPWSKHRDRHKPEVVAPAGPLTTIDGGGRIGQSFAGTSAAAPHVAATVAIMIEAKRLLALWPEAVKSILMATALNDTDRVNKLRSADGAGGIDGYRAAQVAGQKLSKGTWGGMKYENNAPKRLEVTRVYLHQGRRTRVAASWANLAGTGFLQIPHHWEEPSLDLDLQVFDSNGKRVASSASFDSNNEVVEFVPQASGWYQVRLIRYRVAGGLFPPPARYLGWAWYQDR